MPVWRREAIGIRITNQFRKLRPRSRHTWCPGACWCRLRWRSLFDSRIRATNSWLLVSERTFRPSGSARKGTVTSRRSGCWRASSPKAAHCLEPQYVAEPRASIESRGQKWEVRQHVTFTPPERLRKPVEYVEGRFSGFRGTFGGGGSRAV